MKRSFIVLACAGFCLAFPSSRGQAQVGGAYVIDPSPTPIFKGDAPEATPPHGFINLPKYRPRPQDSKVYTPTITGARMVKGRVQFTFTGSRGSTMRYIIRWSRPGLAEVADMRWTTGSRSVEEYIINEKPLPDTVYYFRVQAQGKNKIDGQYPLTHFVGMSFRTPPGLSMADKIGVIQSPGFSSRPSKSDPYGLSKVETPVRLKPGPIIGR